MQPRTDAATGWMRSIVLALACGAPLTVAIAQAPAPSNEPAAPQPEQQQSSEADRDRDRVRVRTSDGRELRPPGSGGGDGRDGRGPELGSGEPGPAPAMDRPPPFDAPTAEEWDRCEAFSKEHGPKRWAILQTLDEERQQFIRGMVFARYRFLERMRTQDPEMYQIHLKRFAIEDDIFGIRYPIRAEGRYPTQEEFSRMRERAAAWVDVGLEERELRVQRLREMLKREEDFLASERTNRESAVAERLSIIEQGRGMGLGRRREMMEGGGGFSPAPRPQQQQAPTTAPSP